MKKIGFSGTQMGMSDEQKSLLTSLLRNLKEKSGFSTLIHGDCIGSDSQAHKIAKDLGFKIEIFPPKVSSKRAFCGEGDDIIHDKEDYLVRNRLIVDSSDFLIAATKSSKEELRSGTWSTVRYARKRKKKVIILSAK
jgi:hypothetical protein